MKKSTPSFSKTFDALQAPSTVMDVMDVEAAPGMTTLACGYAGDSFLLTNWVSLFTTFQQPYHLPDFSFVRSTTTTLFLKLFFLRGAITTYNDVSVLTQLLEGFYSAISGAGTTRRRFVLT